MGKTTQLVTDGEQMRVWAKLEIFFGQNIGLPVDCQYHDGYPILTCQDSVGSKFDYSHDSPRKYLHLCKKSSWFNTRKPRAASLKAPLREVNGSFGLRDRSEAGFFHSTQKVGIIITNITARVENSTSLKPPNTKFCSCYCERFRIFSASIQGCLSDFR